jgi:hypothetical protein
MKPSIEQAKIASIARHYEAEGYKVFARLAGYEKPPRMGTHEPDLLVRKGEETIVIAIKTGSVDKERQVMIEQLARYASGTKGMRFDLVVTNPKPDRAQRGARDSRLLMEMRRSLLQTLDATVASQPKAFLVISGLVVEDLLRGVAEHREHLLAGLEGDRFEEQPLDIAGLANHLMERHLISEAARDFFVEVLQLRNAVIHGVIEPVTNLRLIHSRIKSLAKDYGWHLGHT